jgi:hypothetical protein
VTPDWSNLFKLKFVPSAITFNRWLLDIRRRENGSWDSDEWFQSFTQASVNGGWPLTGVAFHQGECHWVDNFAETSQEIVLQSVEGSLDRAKQNIKLSGKLAGLAAPLAVEFTGQGHFLTSADWAGDLKLTDQNRSLTLHVEDRNQTLDAQGQAAEWPASQAWSFLSFYSRWKGGASSTSSAMLSNWKSHFTWTSSSMTFYQAGALDGGPAEIKGEETSGPLAMTLTVSLQDVPVAALASLTGENIPIDGKLTTASRLAFSAAAHPLSTLEGEGAVEIHGGALHFSEGSLHSLSKAHTMAYLKAKYPNVADNGLPLKQMRLHYKSHNGAITVDEAVLDAGEIKASLAGKLDGARRGMDAYTCLQIRETDRSLLKKLPGHYLYGTPGHEAVLPIFGHVQGSWSEWSVRAVNASRVPAALRPRLRRLTAP